MPSSSHSAGDVPKLLDKRYVWVVGEDEVAHQKLITIKHEQDDIFVINDGIGVKDKIVLEGVRQIEEGGKVEYKFRKPEEAAEPKVPRGIVTLLARNVLGQPNTTKVFPVNSVQRNDLSIKDDAVWLLG